MESEDSLQYSQDPSTGPYPEPDETNPHPQSYLSKIILILSFHLRLGLPSILLLLGIPAKIFCKEHT
jgi:hypothetical protein